MRPRSRCRVTIVIETENTAETLTSAERWDIIVSAAVATRSAIEQYVTEGYRDKFRSAIARVMLDPSPTMVKYRTYETEIEVEAKP
jgi:hypothetical protein